MIDVLLGIWRQQERGWEEEGKKYNSNGLDGKTRLTSSILFITSTCLLLSPCFLCSVTIKIYPLRIWSFRFCDKRKLSPTFFTFLHLSYSFFNFFELSLISPKQITEQIFLLSLISLYLAFFIIFHDQSSFPLHLNKAKSEIISEVNRMSLIRFTDSCSNQRARLSFPLSRSLSSIRLLIHLNGSRDTKDR